MNTETKMRFMHVKMENPELVGPEGKPGNGGFSAAWYYDKETGTVKFTLAICSPKDKFSRPRGRFISTKRLEDGRTCGSFPIAITDEGKPEPRYGDVANRILAVVAAKNKDVLGDRLTKRIPEWFPLYRYDVPEGLIAKE